jgi:phosphoenolpyruvate-protein kinase (PTS system EI component)
LITQFGGDNSHMAIRAAEIGLPAAIGVGEKLYEAISMMTMVELDCGNQLIRRID